MRRWKTLALVLALTVGLCAPAAAVDVLVDGVPLESDVASRVVNQTTYVSLRALTQRLRPDSTVGWEGTAVARAAGLNLTAAPGQRYIVANGHALYVPGGVLAEGGRTLVPVRTLAKALGAGVEWDASIGAVQITSGRGAIGDAAFYYKEDELYWLSRIISSESQGESLEGKIAVGNVVLNRVESAAFPGTIYGVIFDERWGGQFEPVRNGTIFNEPTAESVLAAKLCLDGAETAGDSLYFLAPKLTNNHWIMENRVHVVTIGTHWFYR